MPSLEQIRRQKEELQRQIDALTALELGAEIQDAVQRVAADPSNLRDKPTFLQALAAALGVQPATTRARRGRPARSAAAAPASGRNDAVSDPAAAHGEDASADAPPRRTRGPRRPQEEKLREQAVIALGQEWNVENGFPRNAKKIRADLAEKRSAFKNDAQRIEEKIREIQSAQ